MPHTQRFEQPVRYKILPVLTADLFYQLPRHDIHTILINKRASEGIGGRDKVQPADDLFTGEAIDPETIRIPEPGIMRKQVPYSQLRRHIGIIKREFGEYIF